jgi:hypothetical protein
MCLLRGNVGWIGLIEVVIDHLPGAAKVPAIYSDEIAGNCGQMDAAEALWFIFIDHIPDNAVDLIVVLAPRKSQQFRLKSGEPGALRGKCAARPRGARELRRRNVLLSSRRLMMMPH